MLHMQKWHPCSVWLPKKGKWFGYGCCGNPKSSNMDVVMVPAWMLWYWEALENGCYYRCGMDALVIRKARNGCFLWFWHRCSGNLNRKHCKMDVTMLPVWMPRNASFKNELLCRHCSGDCGGKRSRPEQLAELPRKQGPHTAGKNPSHLERGCQA